MKENAWNFHGSILHKTTTKIKLKDKQIAHKSFRNLKRKLLTEAL